MILKFLRSYAAPAAGMSSCDNKSRGGPELKEQEGDKDKNKPNPTSLAHPIDISVTAVSKLLIRTGHKCVPTVSLFDWGGESLMVPETKQRQDSKRLPVSTTCA